MNASWGSANLILLFIYVSISETKFVRLDLDNGVFRCKPKDPALTGTFPLSQLCDGVRQCKWWNEGIWLLDGIECTYDCYPRCINGGCIFHECRCDKGYIGDACDIETQTTQSPVEEPDSDSCGEIDCGPHSFCKNARCGCNEGAFGKPPNCRLNCETDTECPGKLKCSELHGACIISDACRGLCGRYATCMASGPGPRCECDTNAYGYPPHCRLEECLMDEDCSRHEHRCVGAKCIVAPRHEQ